MSSYTVHEPAHKGFLPAASAPAQPERFVFVRDGFSVFAFLLTPLWMLRYRLWLVLVIYLAVTTLLEMAMTAFGAPAAAAVLVGVLISFLVGLEAGSLRRFTLARQGWRQIGVVCGDGREDAEQRFFSAWTGWAGAQRGTPPSTAPAARDTPASAAAHQPHTQTIIGLFPEPGT